MSTSVETRSEEYQCPGSVLLGMCIGVSLYWLFAMSMGALLPSIAATMGVQATDLNLGLASSMAAGICIVPAGGLADRYGRVLLTRIGLGIGDFDYR